MKTVLFFLLVSILSLLPSCIFGQNIHWNSTPAKGFVFEISNNEAQKLLKMDTPDTIFKGLLHTQIDTFDVAKGWVDRPSKGHFILARISENKLICDYTCVFPYQVFLLREYDALSLQVVDLNGKVRDDAKVKFKFRRLRIDPESKTYRLENDWFYGDERTVTVELDGFRSLFDIQRHNIPAWNDYGNHDNLPEFYSYMITDKNKYKPNEHVRFKSYALSGQKWPLRKDLEIWLDGGRKYIKMGIIEPYRPGSYSGEFQLHDSLKLLLDKFYTLQLREQGGRIVANCRFKYEDYELMGNKLEVRLDKNNHFFPEKNVLTITATDINNLMLKDAKATILIKPHSIHQTFQPVIVLPDTLLFTKIDLDPNNPTKIDILPDLFQKTNTSYDMIVSVLNSDNQRMEKVVVATYFYSRFELVTHFSNDSVCFDILQNGKPMVNVPITMRHNGEAKGKEIFLPYKEKLNPLYQAIYFDNKYVSSQISMSHLTPELIINGGLVKDSFNIQLVNPQKLDVSWYIYQGGTLLKKGFGKELDYKSFIEDRTQTFYVELLYSFGGEDHVKRSAYDFKEESLNVTLNIPEKIYPGQNVDASIVVKDPLGEPVRGVDLTALAVTGKLGYDYPDLPYYGSSSVHRIKKANYTKNDINKRSAVLDLDYKKWEKPARLDTMTYYQFTYPLKSLFRHETPIADSTQFAPFVMFHGLAKQVYVIEVDRQPVYYSWVDQPKDYSFYIAPGKSHQISLRLYDRVLILDSVYFKTNAKTILSVDLDHLPAKMITHKLKNEFSQTELNRHHNYIASFETGGNTAWLESANCFYPLLSSQSGYYSFKNKVVAGPVLPGRLTYNENGTEKITYTHTGSYDYSFQDNIVYRQDAKSLIPAHIYDKLIKPITFVNDMVLTKDHFFESKSEAPVLWHERSIDVVENDIRLQVLLPYESMASGVASVFFEDVNTKKQAILCQSYSSITSPLFDKLSPGSCTAYVIYNNGTFLKQDSVFFRKFSTVVVNFNQSHLYSADSLSKTWVNANRKFHNFLCRHSPLSLKSDDATYRYTQASYGNVHGTVYDESNDPLPGANIQIEGSSTGAISDINGHFTLDFTRQKATLIFTYIGYDTKKMEVATGSDISVTMAPDLLSLDEVVVVGYGVQTRKNCTGSVSYVDGENLSRVPDDKIEEASTGKDDKIIHDAEQRLYQELLTLNSIRSNFSDIGFWEPRLFTDKKGVSKFNITFPDDITKWEAVVYAMNSRAQTGMIRKSIKSYKPLMAELHIPQFLIRGDSALFLGKILNYTSDSSIVGNIKWSGAPGKSDKTIQFKNFLVDKVPVNPAGIDSVKTRFTFTRNDGYMDGEERGIPVFEQGAVRANGTLSVLKDNDDLTFKALDNQTLTIEILNDQKAVYGEDLKTLLDYKYACNEQLASKLIGLVNYKLLQKYDGRAFNNDTDIQKIIRRLLKNQNQEFLWSWWDVSPNTSYWMSAHILRALKCAKDAGYTVDLNIENLTRKADYRFGFLNETKIADIDLLNALAGFGIKLNYMKKIQALDSMITAQERLDNKTKRTNYCCYNYSLLKEKFLLQEIRQIIGLPYERDSVLTYKKENMLGEVYFTDNKLSDYWYNNTFQANIVAYRIIKRDSLLRKLQLPMQLYFLSTRKKNEWNTYELSNVLMTILPDLLKQGVTAETSVTVHGKADGVVVKFPYKIILNPHETLNIHKELGLPVYLMQYAYERVAEATSGLEGFEIKTNFSNNSLLLETGKPVSLEVHVKVINSSGADHVMIEIPVPGACSYADKHLQDEKAETHREYFKERIVIFCENMKPGSYTFYVHLLPRFTGKYMLNPAQVSLMYLPVINANTDLKKVNVVDQE